MMEDYRELNGKDNPTAMDPWILGIASAAALITLFGSVITCLCCVRRNRNSRNDDSSGSDSRGDTVPLEDLLSKPTLADPESVFSEFRFDGRLSNEDAGFISAPDEGIMSSLISSSPTSQESVDECQQQTSDQKASKKFGKDKKGHTELNNCQSSLYNKNSDKNQTLQNDLSYVSNKTNLLQDKIGKDKKINDALQRETDKQKKKNRKTKDDLDPNTFTGCDRSKSSLEVVDTNRNSSGSESVSFSSSARGSVCHDIGTSANAFRLPRTSIFPRPDGWNRRDSRKDGDEEVRNLPDLLESPFHKTVKNYTNSHDVQDTVIIVNEVCGHTDMSHMSDVLAANLKQGQENFEDQIKLTHSFESQNGKGYKEKDQFNFDAKRLQTSCSYDGLIHDQRHRRLPERISLNLQIDFHFPNQGQTQGERPVPVVVCSSMTDCNDSILPVVSTKLPAVSTKLGENNEIECSKSPQSTSNPCNETLSERIETPKSEQEEQSLNNSNISKEMSSSFVTGNNQYLRYSSEISISPKMPSWVKSRLSVPLDLCRWREKMSQSPNLKRRSFTVADFQSLKFQSLSEINATYIASNILPSKNMDDIKKQNTIIDTSTDIVKDNEMNTSIITKELVEKQSNEREGEMKQKDRSQSHNTQEIIVNEITGGTIIQNMPLVSAEDTHDTVPRSNNPSNKEEEEEEKKEEEEEEEEEKEENSGDVTCVQDTEMAVGENSVENKNALIPEVGSTEAAESDMKKTTPSIVVSEKSEDEDEEEKEKENKPEDGEQSQHEGIERTYSSNKESTTETLNQELTLLTSGEDPTSEVLCEKLTHKGEESTNKSSSEALSGESTPEALSEETTPEALSGESTPEALSDGSTHRTLSECSIHKDMSEESLKGGLCEEMTPKASSVESTSPQSTSAILSEESTCKSLNKEPSEVIYNDGCRYQLDDIDQNKFSTSLEEEHRQPAMRENSCSRELPKSSSCGYLPQTPSLSITTSDNGLETNNNNNISYPKQSHHKANSADTSRDTNIASDDSDYDNPWDSLDNAVHRASMKYHKRPSVAASNTRELMLKSAEDLGRLIELAETRRRERQHSTKSTSDEFDCDAFPGFKRNPFRHTVKGVLSHKSADRLDLFGGKHTRNTAGSHSLRKSKDDSDHYLDTGKSQKLSKSRKWYSPESRKKRDFMTKSNDTST